MSAKKEIPRGDEIRNSPLGLPHLLEAPSLVLLEKMKETSDLIGWVALLLALPPLRDNLLRVHS